MEVEETQKLINQKVNWLLLSRVEEIRKKNQSVPMRVEGVCWSIWSKVMRRLEYRNRTMRNWWVFGEAEREHWKEEVEGDMMIDDEGKTKSVEWNWWIWDSWWNFRQDGKIHVTTNGSFFSFFLGSQVLLRAVFLASIILRHPHHFPPLFSFTPRLGWVGGKIWTFPSYLGCQKMNTIVSICKGQPNPIQKFGVALGWVDVLVLFFISP